jgi:hypothetical protein
MNSGQVDEQSPETMQEQSPDDSGCDTARLVPVVESIRYRRRAQSAEKKAETLAEQLAQADQKIAQLSEDLGSVQLDQRLTRKLVAAGATDLEAATLMAKARMEGKPDADIDDCVERLRVEKHYLFNPGAPGSQGLVSRKTAGAKDRVAHNQTVLERAAKKAAGTGNRADLQEYLKLRRNLL